MSRSAVSRTNRSLSPQGRPRPPAAACSRMTARAFSSTTSSPRRCSSRRTAVLPTPGPPVSTWKFGLCILPRRGEGGGLRRRAALEGADLDRGELGQVQLVDRLHRGGALAGVEVDALALDRAADVGGVPV